jgi:excinuclease ABC subunit A
MMQKPDVDQIEGLSPAISIEQKTTSRNPRSTVGTVTEIHDYLRLMFARIGIPHSPETGLPIKSQTITEMVDQILSMKLGTRIQIMAPMIKRRKGQHKDIFENARRSGYVRIRVNGEIRDLSEEFNLDKQKWHSIEIVVDRLVIGKTADTLRVSDSVESALKMSAGTVLISDTDGREKLFSERFSCVHCDLSLGEIEPRTFSFNNPHGACVTCTGIGYRLEVDPNLVVPNEDLSISEGAIRPWARNSFSRWWERVSSPRSYCSFAY